MKSPDVVTLIVWFFIGLVIASSGLLLLVSA
ncbi:MAG: hypothetical protein XXXJIFNMEKO3_03189 [Candidatus Erwinia impunctatus]|nr:hypothetical protein XXXJIFNMEKO_03189 [Culicoides impunctatus]